MTESIDRILVPVDFSPPSDRAVRYATTIANRFGARVTLLHVVQDPFVTGAWRDEAFIPNIPELLEGLNKAAHKHIGDVKKDLAAHGFVVDTHILSGQPAQTIVEYAGSGGFDLIVMGTHGRTGLSHAFMGSVAERVVQRAQCAVLTVHSAPAAPASEARGNARTAVTIL